MLSDQSTSYPRFRKLYSSPNSEAILLSPIPAQFLFVSESCFRYRSRLFNPLRAEQFSSTPSPTLSPAPHLPSGRFFDSRITTNYTTTHFAVSQSTTSTLPSDLHLTFFLYSHHSHCFLVTLPISDIRKSSIRVPQSSHPFTTRFHSNSPNLQFGYSIIFF